MVYGIHTMNTNKRTNAPQWNMGRNANASKNKTPAKNTVQNKSNVKAITSVNAKSNTNTNRNNAKAITSVNAKSNTNANKNNAKANNNTNRNNAKTNNNNVKNNTGTNNNANKNNANNNTRTNSNANRNNAKANNNNRSRSTRAPNVPTNANTNSSKSTNGRMNNTAMNSGNAASNVNSSPRNASNTSTRTLLKYIRAKDVSKVKDILDTTPSIDVNARINTTGGPIPWKASKSTLLHEAVKMDAYDIVRYLLKRNASATIPDSYNRYPIQYAAFESPGVTNQRRDSRIIRALLDSVSIDEGGAMINARDSNGKTALHYAVEFNQLSSLKYLAAVKRIEIIRDNSGRTPLHYAVERDMDMVRSLLTIPNSIKDREKLINIKNSAGDTALHTAVKAKQREIAKYLVDKGANTRLRNNMFLTAYNISIKYKESYAFLRPTYGLRSNLLSRGRRGSKGSGYILPAMGAAIVSVASMGSGMLIL